MQDERREAMIMDSLMAAPEEAIEAAAAAQEATFGAGDTDELRTSDGDDESGVPVPPPGVDGDVLGAPIDDSTVSNALDVLFAPPALDQDDDDDSFI